MSSNANLASSCAVNAATQTPIIFLHGPAPSHLSPLHVAACFRCWLERGRLAQTDQHDQQTRTAEHCKAECDVTAARRWLSPSPCVPPILELLLQLFLNGSRCFRASGHLGFRTAERSKVQRGWLRQLNSYQGQKWFRALRKAVRAFRV